jgi:hypothetical protein
MFPLFAGFFQGTAFYSACWPLILNSILARTCLSRNIPGNTGAGAIKPQFRKNNQIPHIIDQGQAQNAVLVSGHRGLL